MNTNTMSYKSKQYLMFAGVTTLVFAAVVIVPFIYGLYLTFTSWDGISVHKPFVGLANYISTFQDGAYWQAMGRTILYSVIAVILVNVVAFILAFLVTSGAMLCLIIVSVWQYAGYMMLIYVAGFMSVSADVLEAAQIDGCNNTQTLIHISVPLMVSSFVQCLFLTITRCFMVYDVNLSLTKGEPFNSSVMAAMYVYNQAFTYKNYGTGQAEALILFVVCAVIGVLQVYIGKKAEVSA